MEVVGCRFGEKGTAAHRRPSPLSVSCRQPCGRRGPLPRPAGRRDRARYSRPSRCGDRKRRGGDRPGLAGKLAAPLAHGDRSMLRMRFRRAVTNRSRRWRSGMLPTTPTLKSVRRCSITAPDLSLAIATSATHHSSRHGSARRAGNWSVRSRKNPDLPSRRRVTRPSLETLQTFREGGFVIGVAWRFAASASSARC